MKQSILHSSSCCSVSTERAIILSISLPYREGVCQRVHDMMEQRERERIMQQPWVQLLEVTREMKTWQRPRALSQRVVSVRGINCCSLAQY